MGSYLLDFNQVDLATRVRFEPLVLSVIEFKPHAFTGNITIIPFVSIFFELSLPPGIQPNHPSQSGSSIPQGFIRGKATHPCRRQSSLPSGIHPSQRDSFFL